MKTIARFLAPLVTALLGYAAATALRAPEEKPRSAPAVSEAVVTAPSAAGGVDADAVASVIVAISGTPSLEDLASGGMAAIEKLSPQEMAALIERVLTMPAPKQNEMAGRSGYVALLMSAWTAHDPEAATEWMRPRLEQYARMPDFKSGTARVEMDLVGAWAANAPKIAVEVARRYAEADVGGTILSDAIFAWPDKDYARRFEVLREFPPSAARQRVLPNLCNTWSQIDSAAALAGIASLGAGEERSKALREALTVFAGRDAAGALSRAEAFGVADDPKTAQRLVLSAAGKTPAAVARWLEARDPAVLRDTGGALVLRWAESDPSAAFAWALRHGIDLGAPVAGDAESRGWLMRTGINYNRPMEIALEKKPDAVMAWLRALPAGAARDTAVEQELRAMRDPQRMMPLLAMLPPDAAPRAATLIGQKFQTQSFDAGRGWAESLPPGPTRTAAWTALGSSYVKVPDLPRGPDREALLRGKAQMPISSISPAEWQMARTLEIDDPALRRATFDEVMTGWIASPNHRESAAPWLDGATVPPEWKAQWRDRLK